MRISRNQLLQELSAKLDVAATNVNAFKTLPTEKLNFKNNAESWSILECIEHLNLYGDFYLPEIEQRILNAKPQPQATEFKSGFIGNYFANLLLPKNGSIKKMKTFKDKNPIHSSLTTTTLDRFLKQNEKLQALLKQAEGIDITATKTAISISTLIKLRLGDTFRFVIYHIERHIAQAERCLQ